MCSSPAIDISVVQQNIPDFPQEILEIIFENLSTKDRKAVKLVCKSWFEACNSLRLTNDEVLNCLGIYQLADIYELLDASKRKILNLKFDFVHFNDSSFWENNGSRIKSIAFKDCQFAEGVDKIIISCINLLHLSFTYSTSLPPVGGGRKVHLQQFDGFRSERKVQLQLFDDFQKVFENGIPRENMESLKIDIHAHTYIYLSDRIMCQLFSLYPKLKVLKINYCEFFRYNFKELGDLKVDYSDPFNVSDTDFTFAPILNYFIASTDRIEKLKLHVPISFPPGPFSTCSVRCILETLTSLRRLTKLSINLGRSLQHYDVHNFLHSKPLKSFGYSRWDGDPVFLDSLLSKSKLENLKVWGPSSVDPYIATEALLEKLMSSGLKSCKMFINNSILVADPNSFSSEFSADIRPTTISSLSVNILRHGPWETRVEMVQFLQYSKNILHLQLDNASYEELVTLLRYQTKLRSLITTEEGGYRITFPENCVNDFKNAFYQLTDLEHVELSYSVAYQFLRPVSPGSVLENLKYLRINRFRSVDEDMVLKCLKKMDPIKCEDDIKIAPSDLLKLADVAPYLEGLYINYDQDIPLDVAAALCTKLSRLRFLRWDTRGPLEDDSYTDEDYRKLFMSCPSLRVLSHCIFNNGPNALKCSIYFFNTINKEVIPILEHIPYLSKRDLPYYYEIANPENGKTLYTFAKPRIAKYIVDWLRF